MHYNIDFDGGNFVWDLMSRKNYCTTMTRLVCLHAGSTSNRIGPGRTFRVLYNTRQGFRTIKFQTPILLLNDTKRGEHRIHPGRTACGPQVFIHYPGL